jgi:hypothetical protein
VPPDLVELEVWEVQVGKAALRVMTGCLLAVAPQAVRVAPAVAAEMGDEVEMEDAAETALPA